MARASRSGMKELDLALDARFDSPSRGHPGLSITLSWPRTSIFEDSEVTSAPDCTVRRNAFQYSQVLTTGAYIGPC